MMRGATEFILWKPLPMHILKPHACSGIFEIQAVSRHCFVSSSFKILGTKNGIASIWEVPKVYVLTCSMQPTMLIGLLLRPKFGRNDSTCWLYYSKCFTLCQHLQNSRSWCFVNETWWGDSEHHMDAHVPVFHSPTESVFTCLLLSVFAKDSTVMFCNWVGPCGQWSMPRNAIHVTCIPSVLFVHSSCQKMYNFKICADIFWYYVSYFLAFAQFVILHIPLGCFIPMAQYGWWHERWFGILWLW